MINFIKTIGEMGEWSRSKNRGDSSEQETEDDYSQQNRACIPHCVKKDAPS
jgi:hypothetical protein